ncbi:MAG: carboxymuconolactone decarboxylase family protein [Geminicoccaceae bacterium]
MRRHRPQDPECRAYRPANSCSIKSVRYDSPYDQDQHSAYCQCQVLLSGLPLDSPVASQIPCQYCIYYHTKAALAEGATEQELREATAIAAYVRNWSTVLYGGQADFEEYKKTVDTLFPSE